MQHSLEIRAQALACLLHTDPAVKMTAVAAMANAWAAGDCVLDSVAQLTPQATIPGRPEQPLLVAPRLLGRRSMVTVEGRAMLIHALAHIEFNATKIGFSY